MILHPAASWALAAGLAWCCLQPRSSALPQPGQGAKPGAKSRRARDGCIQSRAEGAHPRLTFLGAGLQCWLLNIPPAPRVVVGCLSHLPWGWGHRGGPWGTDSPGLPVSHGTAEHRGAEPGKFPSLPPPLERLLLTFGLICMWVGGWKRWQQLNQF